MNGPVHAPVLEEEKLSSFKKHMWAPSEPVHTCVDTCMVRMLMSASRTHACECTVASFTVGPPVLPCALWSTGLDTDSERGIARPGGDLVPHRARARSATGLAGHPAPDGHCSMAAGAQQGAKRAL